MKKIKLTLGTLLAIAGLIGCLSQSDDLKVQAAVFAGSLVTLLIGAKLMHSSGYLK